jgi:hypothetical protein
MLTRKHKVVSVAVALTAVAALLAKPAAAQYGGPPQQGHWKYTLQSVGAAHSNWTTAYGQPGSGTQTINSTVSYTSVGGVMETATSQAQRSAAADFSVTITINAQWVDYMGNPTSYGLPHILRLKVGTSANWSTSSDSNDGTGAANDGQGDEEVKSSQAQYSQQGSSSGTHLIQRSCDSGSVSVPVTLSGNCQTVGIYQASAHVDWHLSVAEDPRGVTISSDIDTTYKRVIANTGLGVQEIQSWPNVPDSDGAMYGDTVAPLPHIDGYPWNPTTQNVTYTGAPVGAWSDGTTGLWKSSLLGASDLYILPYAFPFQLTYANAPATASATDTISLKLQDPADQAIAENTYTMRFHPGYDDWFTMSTIQHPITPTDANNLGPDWYFYSKVGDGGTVTGAAHVTISLQVTKSESATIGGSVVTQINNPWGWFSANSNWSINSATSTTVSYSVTKDYNIPSGNYLKIFVGETWTQLTGTASQWGLHGYGGEVNTTGEIHPGTFSLWAYPYELGTQ